MAELERELDHVHLQYEEPIKYSEQAIEILKSKIEMLKTFLEKYNFANPNEEIDFFKVIKSQFTSKLLYYNDIFDIETCKPCGNEKTIHKYYKSELEKLKAFFNDNMEFYKYHRTESIHLDSKYFLRGEYGMESTLDNFVFQAGNCSSHDFKLAKIMANELLRVYLECECAKLECRNTPKQQPVTIF